MPVKVVSEVKLADVKNNPEIMQKLRWDLTPQTASIGKFEITCQADMDRLSKLFAEKAGYFFYVDVANCQARLALIHNRASGNGNVKYIRDFKSPLLEKAVYEAGGSITTSGWYPLSKRIEKMLRRRLMEKAPR